LRDSNNHHGADSELTATNKGWQPTWPVNGRLRIGGIALPALVQIDHVLIGPALSALDNRIVRVDGTDHAIVVAEVAPR
jgi:hypothetical protein